MSSVYYTLADKPRVTELEALTPGASFRDRQQLAIRSMSQWGRFPKVMAQAVAERRPPKRGEWYLSGAIPEAYRAPNDCTTVCQIVRLVLVEEIVTRTLREVTP